MRPQTLSFHGLSEDFRGHLPPLSGAKLCKRVFVPGYSDHPLVVPMVRLQAEALAGLLI